MADTSRRGASGQARIKHGTLAPDVVTTVELYGAFSRIEILNIDGGRIYARSDGQDPVWEGDDCDVLPGPGALEIGVRRYRTDGIYAIKLLSDTAVSYSVKGVY